MSNRFDTTGGFSPPVIKTPPSSTATVAGYSSSQKAGDQLASDSRSSGGGSGKEKAGPAKSSQQYEFEGNRLGISPMKIGLLIGIGLIAYGLLGSISFSGSEASGKQVQHEYKRQLRPVDLIGR